VLATTALWPLVAGFELLSETALAALFAGIGADLVAVYAVAAYGRPRHLTWLAGVLAAGVQGAVTLVTLALDGWLLELPITPASMSLLLVPAAAPYALLVAPVWTAGFLARLRREGVVSRERRAVAASTAGAVELAYAERLRIAAGLRAAVLRTADERPPWRPEQAVGLDVALASFTRHPAWLASEEEHRGTLREGFLADLVVLDRDPGEDLEGASVVATMVGGRWVHGPWA
jgi:hypothetical protein